MANKANNLPIGVFDSGIGGLTVVKELQVMLPNEKIIYFGDTLRAPYGSRQPQEILSFMQEILNFFLVRDVKMAVVACNTMTVLGLDLAKEKYPFLCVGVNTGVNSALKSTKTKHIGVLATQATILNGKHYKSIKKQDDAATVFAQACPKFVPLIEKGCLTGHEIREAVYEYLLPMKEAGVDSVILGCTHYPYISDAISEVVGNEITLVNPAFETALDAKKMLEQNNLLSSEKLSRDELCFSADLGRVKGLAQKLIDISCCDFKIVNLQDFQ